MSNITITVPDQHLSRAISALRFQYENCIQAVYEERQRATSDLGVQTLEGWATTLANTFNALRNSVPQDYKFRDYVCGDDLASEESIIQDFIEEQINERAMALERFNASHGN